jgi:peptidase M1-like protein
MKSCWLRLCLCFLCCFCASAVKLFSLGREAFSFTNYDLSVRIEPDQQRLGVRGKITLRNDSATPQKFAVLQISSSLGWRSIEAGGKPLQFVAQPYTSDIDHTGMLSEVIVTLPAAVAPKGTAELEIAYEGVIVLDATRLVQIGAPDAQASSSDWDQISTKFTAVRGVGYVAWYPIATEDASLSEGKSLFEVVGRWKAREEVSTMHLRIEVPSDEAEAPELLVNATACPIAHEEGHQFVADCTYRSLGSLVPTFVIADYEVVERPAVAVHYLHGQEAAATSYAEAAEKVLPLVTDWFGAPRNKAETAELVDPNAAPFESNSLLLTPSSNLDSKGAGLIAVHQLTHAAFSSPRPWINEGLAHFMQALYVEHQSGRQAALDYVALHSSGFSAAEREAVKQTAVPRSEDEVGRSLINTSDEEFYRSKAMCVWWMLRDVVGEAALKKALAAYHPEQDKEPSYIQKLIQAQTQKDLEWFFDDWVYRDRGLPDFKIESAFPRNTMTNEYLVTVTVANLGRAGAEVPVTVKYAGGEVTNRVVVRGNSKAVIRVEIAKPPQEVVVNDGSVPESETTNNTFKIEGEAAK